MNECAFFWRVKPTRYLFAGKVIVARPIELPFVAAFFDIPIYSVRVFNTL